MSEQDGRGDVRDAAWSPWHVWHPPDEGLPELAGLDPAQTEEIRSGALRAAQKSVDGPDAGLGFAVLWMSWLIVFYLLGPRRLGAVILAAIVFASAAVVWGLVVRRRRVRYFARRLLGVYCPRCGFDLRGGHGRCPECGRWVDRHHSSVSDGRAR